MLYGLESVALNKRQQAKLEGAKLKMLRFPFGVTRMDRIRSTSEEHLLFGIEKIVAWTCP